MLGIGWNRFRAGKRFGLYSVKWNSLGNGLDDWVCKVLGGISCALDLRLGFVGCWREYAEGRA